MIWGLLAHYGDGLKNTLLLDGKWYLSMVTTQLSYRFLLEFRKEASLGLCFSWFISMIFLLICINFSNIHIFADDTKCSHQIKSTSDTIELQSDLDMLNDWSNKWNLSFNSQKCVLLKFYKNPSLFMNSSYFLSGRQISPKESHRDLGIILQQDLGWHKHYDSISAKAYRQLGLLRRTFSSSNSVYTKKKLYLSLVRSQLLYCSQLWRPMLVKDTEALERIQKRATKFILGNSDGDYKERLVKLKLLPLMYSFELADIMFFVNSFKNKTNRFCITDFVSISCSNTRSSDKLTLRHTRSSLNQHRHFYFNRLPRLWNCLPAIDMSLSSQCIKTLIKRFLWSHFVTHFDPYNICSFHFLCPCSRCSTMHMISVHL